MGQILVVLIVVQLLGCGWTEISSLLGQTAYFTIVMHHIGLIPIVLIAHNYWDVAHGWNIVVTHTL